MKNVTKILFIAMLGLFLFTCKKKTVELQKDAEQTEVNEENIPATYYISFKVNGVATTFKEVDALRDIAANPRVLTISGNAGSGANPKFKFNTEESFIGFVKGLNIGTSLNTYPHYVEYVNSAGILFSTTFDNDGIYVFLSEVSYSKGGLVSGTFNGSIKNDKGDKLTITEGKFNLKFSN